MKIKITILCIFLLSFAYCQLGITSDYTGGITQATLIGDTWQEINTDFDGTYRRWFFMNDTQVVNSLRGVTLYYDWEPFEISGTVNPNPQNQAVFRLKSNSPGGVLYQYMLVWFINAEGTSAVFQVYTTPQDVTRYLVNVQHSVSGPNFNKIIVP